jgi:hypothetical protein
MTLPSGRRTIVGYDLDNFFAELVKNDDVDVAIVSTEGGFSLLGASRDFFEAELGISYDREIRPIAHWNHVINEQVKLITFKKIKDTLLGIRENILNL